MDEAVRRLLCFVYLFIWGARWSVCVKSVHFFLNVNMYDYKYLEKV